jgi:SAM-dependent methyltransferase
MGFPWSRTQTILLFILVVLCINYLIHVAFNRLSVLSSPDLAEGFEGAAPKDEKTDPLYSWMSDPQAYYDDFYADVYDQLSQQQQRSQAKVAIIQTNWKKDGTDPKTWSVLDAGCGTGHAALAFAKLGVGKIIGLDYSPAMIRYAQNKAQPAAKLTPEQAETIRWRVDSLINPSSSAAGEFSHIYCFYFTLYYLENKEEFFRHCNLWTKPGGKLVVEVVNKHKFDPLLESASPFVGFSLQKYSEERLRKSRVAFDKFDYEGEFALTADPKAEFYETFRFKNGSVRRQKHIFLMPNIADIVEMGKRAGWKYTGFQDLNPIGFEYGYLLFFEK